MKKKLLRTLFLVLMMLPVLAFAHFMVFPQETRCMLIQCSSFEKEGNIYFRKNIGAGKIKLLQEIQSAAERKVRGFWKSNINLNYNLIYCDNKQDFANYGVAGAPAATQLKMGAYVVVSSAGLDTSVIAHEISHTILYNNIGWYRTKFKIPTWFDEGLAMQVDDRDYYSVDTLMAKKAAGVKLPDVIAMSSPKEFFTADYEVTLLRFATAKYIVREWLKEHSLSQFISDMNAGKPFPAGEFEKYRNK